MEHTPGNRPEGALVKVQKPKLPVGRPSKVSLRKARKEVTDKQLQYVMWVSTPEAYRDPKSRYEFAESIGVTDVTVWRWSKDPKVLNAIRWMVLHNAGAPDRVSRIFDLLMEVVEDENQSTKLRLQAAREYLNGIGVKQVWKEPDPELLVVQDVDEIDLSELSEEEIWDLYNEYAKQSGELPGPAPDGQDDEVADGELMDESYDS